MEHHYPPTWIVMTLLVPAVTVAAASYSPADSYILLTTFHSQVQSAQQVFDTFLTFESTVMEWFHLSLCPSVPTTGVYDPPFQNEILIKIFRFHVRRSVW